MDNSLKKGRITNFSNKIGLFDPEKQTFINGSGDVVLSFPFKDCILEGGMSDEESGREEKFFHEILDRADIDTLRDPKVLTKFEKIDKDSIRTISNPDEIEFWDEDGELKENLLIKGNNLIALHSINQRFSNKIKLIYIDPPFNTGNDSFDYNDNFRRSSWLVFMKNRLEVAKSLLSEDGSIFVHCDENENAYIKVLLDEVFGKDNFMNEIIWRYRTYIGQVKEYFPKKHDTIYWFKKNNRPEFNLIYEDNLTETVDYQRWYKYIVDGNKIRFGNHPTTDSRFTAYLNRYIKQIGEPKIGDIIYEVQGYVIDDVWEDIIALDPKNITERTNFKGGQKPEALVERIINAVTKPGDIILDYHLGSGTTSAVAHKMGRRWIGIEQMDYIEDIAKVRLQKVIEGEQGGISKNVEWQGGGSFVYMELKAYNIEFIERIESARTKEELHAVYAEMANNAFLQFWFDRKNWERDENYKSLPLEEQKVKLRELLDLNQLYLNLGDMNDSRHHVSALEKALTEKFYGKE